MLVVSVTSNEQVSTTSAPCLIQTSLVDSDELHSCHCFDGFYVHQTSDPETLDDKIESQNFYFCEIIIFLITLIIFKVSREVMAIMKKHGIEIVQVKPSFMLPNEN